MQHRNIATASGSSSSSSASASAPTPATTPTDYIVSQLFDSQRELPPLEPGDKVWNKALVKQIKVLDEDKFVIAALHLANDDIEGAHLIAQNYEGDATANLIHAMLHRREGDYWNSKYWFSRVSGHPLAPSIGACKDFVDQCESAKNDAEKLLPLREQQWTELKELVEWTREFAGQDWRKANMRVAK